MERRRRWGNDPYLLTYLLTYFVCCVVVLCMIKTDMKSRPRHSRERTGERDCSFIFHDSI